jgi:two-component system, OmpR family, response regulator
MPRLLTVDDESGINELIAGYFAPRGFEVRCAESGEAMRAAIAEGGIDVVLLDLGLPGEDGLDLACFLRDTWKGPFIIVSGRGETIDRVVGLEVGADDYVAKPFDLRELLARVRSVLRRAAPGARPADATGGARFAFGGWTLDIPARRLTDRQGAEVTLTRGEFDLLQAFAERPLRVLSRDQLMEVTHNRDAGPFDRTIDVQIGRLRRKLGDDPKNPGLIKAVRGLGYQFTLEVTRVADAGHG